MAFLKQVTPRATGDALRARPIVKRPPLALDPPRITNLGARDWNVRVPFRDPAGKARSHYKTVGPAKKDAQTYLSWYAGPVAAGEAPETVSQTELQARPPDSTRASSF